jgi:hypothetical protein
MTEDWTAVDIRHRNPLRFRCESTFEHRIMIDDEDVTEWLKARKIHWSLRYSTRAMGAEPVLLFKNERDAALFILRWV